MYKGNTFTVGLSGLEFHSHIGVLEQERKVGNAFIVSVRFEYHASRFSTEDLSSTVSYADVFDLIRLTMNKEWLLLESAAESIFDSIHSAWPGIYNLHIRIEKKVPPITGMVGTAYVELA